MRPLFLILVLVVVCSISVSINASEETKTAQTVPTERELAKITENFLIARSALEQRDLKRAKAAISKLEGEMDGSQAGKIRLLWVQYYRAAGDYQSAIKILKDLIREEPSAERQAEYLLEIADLFRSVPMLEAAEDALNFALKKSPRNPRVHYALGRFYLKDRRDSEKAAAHLREYLKLASDNEETRRLRTLLDQMDAAILEEEMDP